MAGRKLSPGFDYSYDTKINPLFSILLRLSKKSNHHILEKAQTIKTNTYKPKIRLKITF